MSNSYHVSVPPFDEVFQDREWTTVDMAQIQDASKFFDSDPNVKTGFNFILNALLNGGIMFKRKGHSIKASAKEWMSIHFCKFIRAVMHSRWCYGFAACAWVADEQYGGKPTVLDLTQLVVKYKLSIYGEPMFKYFYQPPNGSFAMQEVMDVMTFSWDNPDQWGNLRSLILLLIPDHMQEIVLSYYEMVAMKGRAMPPMITEKDKETHDKDNVRVPVVRAFADAQRERMGGAAASSTKDGTDRSDTSYALYQNTQHHFSRTQPTMVDPIMSNMQSVSQVPYFSSHLRLQEGRHFVSAPLPEGPTNLLEFRIARQERAFNVMCVPIALISSNTSTGTKRHQGSGQDASQQSGSFQMFDQSQQALKLELINIIKTMYYSIHATSHLSEYLNQTPTKEWSNEAAAKYMEIEVEMPSLPDENRLQSYYTQGFLKYDALVHYLGSKHGIPEDRWNETPALTIEEANGNFPKEETTPPKKKAKK